MLLKRLLHGVGHPDKVALVPRDLTHDVDQVACGIHLAREAMRVRGGGKARDACEAGKGALA